MRNTDISRTITQFLKQAIQMELIEPVDEIYIQNRLLDCLNLDEYVELESLEDIPDLLDSMDEMIDYAIRNGIIENYQYARDIYEAKIMNLVTPLPSVVNE